MAMHHERVTQLANVSSSRPGVASHHLRRYLRSVRQRGLLRRPGIISHSQNVLQAWHEQGALVEISGGAGRDGLTAVGRRSMQQAPARVRGGAVR